jgi:hypothetical protein
LRRMPKDRPDVSKMFEKVGNIAVPLINYS